MMLRVALLILALGLLALNGVLLLARRDSPGEWVAFLSTRDGLTYAEVYLMRPDGSQLQRLTNLPANAGATHCWLGWTAHQELLLVRGLGVGAFQCGSMTGNATTQVYRHDLTTHIQTPLDPPLNTRYNTLLTVAPFGRWLILFEVGSPQNAYRTPLTADWTYPLTQLRSAYYGACSLSPDEASAACIATDPQTQLPDLYIVETRGQAAPRRINGDYPVDSRVYPLWDGDSVIFGGLAAQETPILRVAADGTHPPTLLLNIAFPTASSGLWLGHGGLLYIGLSVNEMGLYHFDFTSQQKRTLVTVPLPPSDFSLSFAAPGEDWVIFSLRRGQTTNLYRVRWEGGDPQQLTRGQWHDDYPVWSPRVGAGFSPVGGLALAGILGLIAGALALTGKRLWMRVQSMRASGKRASRA